MNIGQKVQETVIFYVTNDIERALGLNLSQYPFFNIVTNHSPIAEEIAPNFSKQICIIDTEIGKELNTAQLLQHPKCKLFIEDKLKSIPQTNINILVFKNTNQIEKICTDNNWQLLNPSAKLADSIENKISQISWLGELALFLPPHEIKELAQITLNEIDEEKIIQYNHGHTGESTVLIRNNSQLEELQNKFPKRTARISKYIEGPVITCNICITEEAYFPSSMSYQITGLQPFTDNPFSTIGNDWFISKEIITEEQSNFLKEIIKKISTKMIESGWFGLFGLDFILDQKNNHAYLLEINARQPASAVFQSILEQKKIVTAQKNSSNYITNFENHIYSLLVKSQGSTKNVDDNRKEISIPEINEGAQIVARNTINWQKKIKEKQMSVRQEIAKELATKGFTVLQYQKELPNCEVLRIQTETDGFMKKHALLNSKATEITDIMTRFLKH